MMLNDVLRLIETTAILPISEAQTEAIFNNVR